MIIYRFSVFGDSHLSFLWEQISWALTFNVSMPILVFLPQNPQLFQTSKKHIHVIKFTIGSGRLPSDVDPMFA